MEHMELEALLEAVLFAHGEPVGADKLAAARGKMNRKKEA